MGTACGHSGGQGWSSAGQRRRQRNDFPDCAGQTLASRSPGSRREAQVRRHRPYLEVCLRPTEEGQLVTASAFLAILIEPGATISGRAARQTVSKWPQTGAIFKDARHPAAAKLYLSWLLSKERQEWVGLWPVRHDLKLLEGFVPVIQHKTYPVGFRAFMQDRARIELRLLGVAG